jgi:S-adenosylmethionine:tRNA ribosyltransferase-isomerase
MSTAGQRTADYDYELPPERIAQHPAGRRDESRLLIVERSTERISHGVFRDLAGLIPAGDAMVLNTSRVIKARLLGTRDGGGAAEILLLEPHDDGSWQALVRPSARIKPGRRVHIADGVDAVVLDAMDEGTRRVRFESAAPVEAVLSAHGHVPLPPYIARADGPDDEERYQTVYAREPGSVAAPTAGLHFTPDLLEVFRAKGVVRADVTLHVGAGTFKPVEHDDPAAHPMHRERFAVSAGAAAALNATRDATAHIWAIGTTTLRVLESVVDAAGHFAPRHGETDIFIRPPHVVRGADRLVTNFHLPRSTLLMLVAAVAGYDLTRRAYEIAVNEGYRFYSYGDAMCVI